MIKVYLSILGFAFFFSNSLFSQATSTYQMKPFPAQFSYLTEEFQIDDQGDGSYAATAKGGEVYYIQLFKATARFNADSLRYMFEEVYRADKTVENIQLNEKGPGKLGNLDAERVVITFMADGAYYTATAVLVRFHLNRKYNSVLLTYEMSARSPQNESRFLAVKKGFEDLASSFAYTQVNYKKYTYAKDSVTIEYPDFWYAGATDTCMLIDDGRCRVTVKAYAAKDSTTSETYAKCERDKMKKSSALYPAFKGNISTEKWRGEELATKFTGSYDYDEFGGRKTRYFLKYIIRRNIGGKMKDYHVLFECPEMYREAYYAGKFEIMFNSLVLPGVAGEVKK
jgi:hypothetical protein